MAAWQLCFKFSHIATHLVLIVTLQVCHRLLAQYWPTLSSTAMNPFIFLAVMFFMVENFSDVSSD